MITHYCFFGNVCVVRTDGLFEESTRYYIGAPIGKNISTQLKWVLDNGARLPNSLGEEFLKKGYLIIYS